LPEAIADVLPEQAKHIEKLRSQLLAHFLSYGYEPVIPPMIQYLDSLLIGGGSDLELQTFTLVDQLSGKTLGVRADMTPQAARIDAHLLKNNEINRLCYCGSVLRTQPTHLLGSREMIQMGAEMFGCDQIEADQESLALLLTALGKVGLSHLLIDLCHAGLVESLLDDCQLDQVTENALHLDLADLRGYHYHTGLMFTVYVQGLNKVNSVTNPIAYGGRYDGVGEGFGRTRPAVGFSFDLLQLSEM
ncbi:unnamed protein product, partial [Darwinula stevensoni]